MIYTIQQIKYIAFNKLSNYHWMPHFYNDIQQRTSHQKIDTL